MSEKIWSDDAWNDYLYWQMQDKKTLKRINQLIQDIERNGCINGIGKPEPLSGDLQGEYSRPFWYSLLCPLLKFFVRAFHKMSAIHQMIAS